MAEWPFVRENAVEVSDADLKEWQDKLVEVLRGSSVVTLKYFRQAVDVDNKLDAGFDPVTVADRECEAFIKAELKRLLPEQSMFGEESGYQNNGSDLCWVVDPIDGTRSFICGVPLWGTLMALNDGTRPVLGGMYQPWSDELYIGSRLGSFFHRAGQTQSLKTSNTRELCKAKLACTTPDLFEEESDKQHFQALAGAVQLVRFGTDCYGYSLLAQGGVDLVVEASLQPYDIQALIPVIEGAGGVVTDWQGGDASLGGRVLAAANQELHAQAMRLLNDG